MDNYFGNGGSSITQTITPGPFVTVMGIFLILFLISLTVLAVAITIRILRREPAGRVGAPRRPAEKGADVLEILNERYAKGEIGEEEYQHIKAQILRP